MIFDPKRSEPAILKAKESLRISQTELRTLKEGWPSKEKREVGGGQQRFALSQHWSGTSFFGVRSEEIETAISLLTKFSI